MHLSEEKRGKYYNFISNVITAFISVSEQPFIFSVN